MIMPTAVPAWVRTIVSSIITAARQAGSSRAIRPYALPWYLNSFERAYVHQELRIAGLIHYSVGEGWSRRLVVALMPGKAKL